MKVLIKANVYHTPHVYHSLSTEPLWRPMCGFESRPVRSRHSAVTILTLSQMSYQTHRRNRGTDSTTSRSSPDGSVVPQGKQVLVSLPNGYSRRFSRIGTNRVEVDEDTVPDEVIDILHSRGYLIA